MPYLMRGKTADSIVVDEPIEGGPVNSDGGYWGEMTVRDAVKFSKKYNSMENISGNYSKSRCGISFKYGF